MRPPPIFLALTLLFWLGIYALRSYIPAAVWNLADELPLHMKSVLAIGTNIVAVGGLFLFRKDNRKRLLGVACAFGVVATLKQVFNSDDSVGPWLALLTWVLFLWTLGAAAAAIAVRREERWVAPAFGGALALQVGLQSAWHGLDVASAQGSLPVLVVAAASALFCVLLQRLPAGADLEDASSAVVWLLPGPALFLAVTLCANIGRLSERAGSSFPLTALLIQLVLLLALLSAGRSVPFALRILLIAVAATAAVFARQLEGGWALLSLTVLFVLIVGMSNVAERRVHWRPVVSIALTSALFFVLLFGFYYRYEFTPLWTLALIPFLVSWAWPLRAQTIPRPHLLMPASLGILTTLLFFLPPRPRLGSAAADTIAILSYNIHQGFDDDGMPGMQRIAAEIASVQPDMAALQEVGRGWTLLGGNDLVAYLRWRFPDYEVVFHPINGQLWGNAIMSRLPVTVATGGTFPTEPGVFRYGWIQAMIQLPGRHVEFYSVHLTADIEARGGDPRLPQARQLLARAESAPLVIVAGDFNAHPEDAPMREMAAGLHDLGAQTGLAAIPTWPAGEGANERLDYIFGRGVRALRGDVMASTASDHRPVIVHIAIDDATAPDTASSNRRSRQPGE